MHSTMNVNNPMYKHI